MNVIPFDGPRGLGRGEPEQLELPQLSNFRGAPTDGPPLGSYGRTLARLELVTFPKGPDFLINPGAFAKLAFDLETHDELAFTVRRDAAGVLRDIEVSRSSVGRPPEGPAMLALRLQLNTAEFAPFAKFAPPTRPPIQSDWWTQVAPKPLAFGDTLVWVDGALHESGSFGNALIVAQRGGALGARVCARSLRLTSEGVAAIDFAIGNEARLPDPSPRRLALLRHWRRVAAGAAFAVEIACDGPAPRALLESFTRALFGREIAARPLGEPALDLRLAAPHELAPHWPVSPTGEDLAALSAS